MSFPIFPSRTGFLFVHLDTHSEPIVINISMWTWSAPPGIYDHCTGSAMTPDQRYPPHVRQWSVPDVSAWLSRVGLSDIAPGLAEAGVDGEVLVELSDADLEKEHVRLGPRVKFRRRRMELMECTKASEMTVAVDQDAASLRACYQAILARSILPKAALVVFPSYRQWHGRNNGDQRQMFPNGTPLFAVEMSDVRLTSFSNGSSVSERCDTSNITLMFPRFSIHALALSDCLHPDLLERVLLVGRHDIELWRTRLEEAVAAVASTRQSARNAPADDEVAERAARQRADAAMSELVEVAPGFTLDQNAVLTQWGSSIVWSTANHKCFPKEFKDAVRTMLLTINRMGKSWPSLPSSVLHHMIWLLSTQYTVNPLAQWRLPVSVLSARANDDDDD
eukprot:m51a1_g3168 hypothetical protein (392) ;mRNA; r:384320-385573